MIENQASSAPQTISASNMIDNNIDYNLKILNNLNSKGIQMNAKMLM